MAHFQMSTGGSKSNEHVDHFLVDIHIYEDGEGKRLQFGAFCDEEKQLAAKTTSSGEKGHECVLTLTDLIRSHAEKGDIDRIVLRASDDKQKGSASFYGRDAKEAKYRPALAVTYYDGPAAPRARLSKEYIKPGKELKVNWTGLYATDLTKVQYCITEKDSKADLQYSDLSGKYVKEKAKKVLIPETSDLPDGTYTLYLRGMDEQGRKGDVKELEFTVDGTAPSLSDISVKAESEKKQKTPTVRWSASDENFQCVTIIVDGRMIYDTTDKEDDSYTIPEGVFRRGGDHEVVLTATDCSGNRSSETMTYRTEEGPIIENVVISPETSMDQPSDVSTPVISFDVDGWRIEDVFLDLGTTPLTDWGTRGHKEYMVPEGTLSQAGSYTFCITVIDGFGEEDTETATYYYDPDIPVIEELMVTPESTAASPSMDREPVIRWRVRDRLFDKVEYQIGSGSWNTMGTTLTGSFRLSSDALSNGTNTISVRAKDQAGNTSSVSTLSYYLSASAQREDYTVTDLSAREYYGKAMLSWDVDAISGGVKVSVHRGNTPTFTPSASTLAAEDVKGTYWTDPSVIIGTVYYKIVTEDLTGTWTSDPLISDAVQYVSPLSSNAFSGRTGSKVYLPTFDFTAPMGSGSIEETEGNLLYSQEDYSLSNDHFDYGLTRTYNSKDERSGMLGRGWSDSYHKELYKNGNDIYFADSDGTCYLFTKSNGSYSCAETKEYTLSETADGYTLEDKDHIVTTFNESGQMTEQKEPNGCSLTYVYSRYGTLESIISNTGLADARILTLSYSQSDPYALSQITLYDGSSLEYTVSSGKLTKVSHRKGDDHIDWPYTYDANGYMTSLKDGEENTYSITYAGGKVSQLMYPNQEKAQFSYGSGTTTVSGKTPDGDTLYTMSAFYDTATGKILSETGKDGQTVEYTYSAAHPYLVSKEKTTVYYETLSSGTVSFQSQQNVTETEYAYDANANITSIETSDGEVTEYTYDSEERLTVESTSIGNTQTDHITYTYCTDTDPDDAKTEVYNIASETESISDVITEYSYDNRGNEETVTTTGDGEVTVTETDYDTQGDPEEETAVSGTGGNEVTQETETEYDAMGRVTKTTTGGITIETEYDFMGRAVTETERAAGTTNLVTSKTYNDNGSLASVTDPRGLTTTYTYDSMNRCVQEHKAGSDITAQDTFTEYGYDENITTTDGRSTKTYTVTTKETVKNTEEETVSETYMDAAGNVIKEIRGDQYIDHSYDGSGNQYAAYTAGAAGNDHLLVLDLYDSQGRSIATIQNPTVSGNTYSTGTDSLVTRTTYNAEGEMATETDEDGIVTSYTYDDRQRITGVTAGSGSTTQTRTVSYSDNITEITDPGGKKTREVTNDSGLTIGMYDYASGSSYTSGIAVTYTYDEKGRTLQETYRDGYSARYVYDVKDRVTEKKWYSGNTLSQRVVYTYNAFGDLASATCYTGSTETCETTYTYDILGRKTSEAVSHSGGTAQTTGYSYDMEGNLAGLMYPNSAQGISSLTYSYDMQNRLTEIRNGSSVMRAISYDSLGRESTVTDRLSGADSITTSYSYDSAGRLITSTAKNDSNTQIEKLTYTYSGTRITQRREQSSLPGITALDETRTYTYDGLGRLTESCMGYGYDTAGNLTIKDTDDSFHTFSYNGMNQVASEYISEYPRFDEHELLYSYDQRGNLTAVTDADSGNETYYDHAADGTLSSVEIHFGAGSTASDLTGNMRYDHNGIRTEKEVGSDTIHYYYAEGKPVLARSSSHTATSLFDGEEIIGAYHGSTWYDYLTDQQGSTMGILKQDGTTATAYSYSDFGETNARYGTTFDNEICYTGAVYDRDFGEYYLNARYYDPATANFLSQDTYRGDTGDYGQWNLYTYCANDPVNAKDPTGRYIETLLDVASIGWSAAAFASNPSWSALGYFLWDVGASFLPFVPGSYVLKATKTVKGIKKVSKIRLRVASNVKELQTGKYIAIGKYSALRKIFKGHGKEVQCHHIIEKRLGHLNLKKDNYPSVALSPSVHTTITKRWKEAIGYNKKAYPNLTKKDLLKAVSKVYYDMPELKKCAVETIEKYYKRSL